MSEADRHAGVLTPTPYPWGRPGGDIGAGPTPDDHLHRSDRGRGHRHHPHHRVAGRTGRRTAVVTTRPRRAPHHPISDVGVIGGCSLPGEGSRARHGVLCLDELPEFRRHVLEVLRQPLEDGVLAGPPHGRPRLRRFSRTGGAGRGVRRQRV
ncbi:MAG: ATP-binding protein [Candidatus Tectomicrobia bacterium]|nr:ATP-binding protein [Candidatus Tectomicrobia bacterium]